MVYSVEERIDKINDNDSARVTAALFNERYPKKNVSTAYVVQLVEKFDATGLVGNKKSVYERDEAREVAVLGHEVVSEMINNNQN